MRAVLVRSLSVGLLLALVAWLAGDAFGPTGSRRRARRNRTRGFAAATANQNGVEAGIRKPVRAERTSAEPTCFGEEDPTRGKADRCPGRQRTSSGASATSIRTSPSRRSARNGTATVSPPRSISTTRSRAGKRRSWFTGHVGALPRTASVAHSVAERRGWSSPTYGFEPYGRECPVVTGSPFHLAACC